MILESARGEGAEMGCSAMFAEAVVVLVLVVAAWARDKLEQAGAGWDGGVARWTLNLVVAMQSPPSTPPNNGREVM
jgi:hypothetical protein